MKPIERKRKKRVHRERDLKARVKLRDFLETEAEIGFFTETLREQEASEIIRKRKPHYIT